MFEQMEIFLDSVNEVLVREGNLLGIGYRISSILNS